MRTPNTACIICEKPLYRRPNELARTRYAACMAHRAQAQSIAGVTEAQRAGLAVGRKKGTNNRTGYSHTQESKAKASSSIAAYYAQNPEKALERALRGSDHYAWKGGASRLNVSIRQLTENRKWMDAVKARDGQCLRCGSTTDLESHHIIELADLIDHHGITTREQARECAALWDLSNGETLCRRCHYAHHGRTFRED